MKKQTLLDANPYLKDPDMREKCISRSVITSCGVEGIKVRNETSSVKITRRKKNTSNPLTKK